MDLRFSNCVLIVILLLIYCNYSAKADDGPAMPQIMEWRDGKGIDTEGNRIVDTWAYDTVNPAGKYVLFGIDGCVLLRQERMESDFRENYSVTDINLGRFLFRTAVFSGFDGTVDVTMKEASGREIFCTLEKAGFYDGTIFAPAGSYQITSAKAVDGDIRYLVTYPEKIYDIADDKPIVVKLQVLDQRQDTGVSQDGENEGNVAVIAEPETYIGKESETEREVSGNLKRKFGKRIVCLLSMITAGIFSVVLFFRKRRTK